MSFDDSGDKHQSLPLTYFVIAYNTDYRYTVVEYTADEGRGRRGRS